MKRLTTLILSVLLIVSCSTVKREQEILTDATPPPDYDPIFVNSTAPYSDGSGSRIVISGVDATHPTNLRMRVHILDKDKKTHYTGATAANFKKKWCLVSDSINGAEKVIKKFKLEELTEKDNQPGSAAIVLDMSGSMGEERALAVQKAIAEFINRKRPADGVAIIKYDSKVVIESALSRSKTELLSRLKINGLEGMGGMTAISDGILAGIKELEKAPAGEQKFILIFTDGWDNSSSVSKDSVTAVARMNGIEINAIDFGVDINKGYMAEFSDGTGGIYSHIYNTKEFDYVFTDIYKRTLNSYIIEIPVKEYGWHTLKIKLCEDKKELLASKSIDNTPDIGSIGLININFDVDKAVVKKDYDEEIESVAALLKAFPGMVIELRGHTDSTNGTSDPNYNQKLSQKRADAVRDALIKKGIQPARIGSKGYGDSVPVADNESEDGRSRNRRTEFVVLRK